MKLKSAILVSLMSVGIGAALGCIATNWIRDVEAREARVKNYTDRGRICLEAAALLRGKQPNMALKYLETRAIAAIYGVPQMRSCDELRSDSQVLLVSAKLYDSKFEDVDWKVDRLTRGDVPDDHPKLSPTMRVIVGKSGA
jgi:hypothetical protein